TLHPNAAERPDAPFKVWAIDLAGPFPPDQDGNQYALIAVDAFSKWVEIGRLPSKHAWRTAEWILNELICRWGRPSLIRVDNGGEWLGEFKAFLYKMDIPVLPITVGNSGANGQAERMIRTFKDILRREGIMEDGYWSDILPMALTAMRMTTAASHGFPPFTIVTG
ncbi:MAG TPA: transposase family protein, partial [Nitrososphaerales archaeon]|nr:transposase family protein [Nitrososphaerales archaeon]